MHFQPGRSIGERPIISFIRSKCSAFHRPSSDVSVMCSTPLVGTLTAPHRTLRWTRGGRRRAQRPFEPGPPRTRPAPPPDRVHRSKRLSTRRPLYDHQARRHRRCRARPSGRRVPHAEGPSPPLLAGRTTTMNHSTQASRRRGTSRNPSKMQGERRLHDGLRRATLARPFPTGCPVRMQRIEGGENTERQ